MSVKTRTRGLGCLLAALATCLACGVAFLSADAAFTTGDGECPTPGFSVMKVTSPADNAEAASYLSLMGIPRASLAGYLWGGTLYWDDGSSVGWQPPEFTPPAGSKGLLVLLADGSWSYAPFEDFSSVPVLCWNGEHETASSASADTSTAAPEENTTSTATPEENTTSTAAPTSTEVPVENTTTTVAPSENETSTVEPTSTPAPPETPVDLTALMKNLKTDFDAAEVLGVSVFTSNVVQLGSSASATLALLRKSFGTVYVGIDGCDAQASTARYIASLIASPETSSVGFYLPYEVATAATTTTYNMCLLGYRSPSATGTASPAPEEFVSLQATLRVYNIGDVLTNLRGTVNVKYEDNLLGTSRTKSLVVTGAGTLTPYTTEVSSEAFRDLSLSLINNGVAGRACTPSSNEISYLLVRNTLQLILSPAMIKSVSNGEKSVCASMQKDAVVVARFKETPLLAVAPKQRYMYGSLIPIRVEGVSTNSLAKGAVKAFASPSAQCSVTGSDSALLEVSLFPDNGPLVAGSAAFVPHLYVTVPVSTASSTKYVCLTFSPPSGGASSAFRVVTLASSSTDAHVQVSVAGVAAAVAPTALTIFNGMEGGVSLGKYVSAATSEGDCADYDAVMSLVGGSTTQFVRFVPLRVTGGTTSIEKAAACRAVGSGEVTTTIKSGVLTFTAFTKLRQPSGVLCISERYIRVDYAVTDPTKWLQSVGGTREYSTDVFVLSKAPASSDFGDATPLTFTGSEYHSDIAIRFSVHDDCSVGRAAVVRSYDGGKVVSLPGTGLGTYSICVGLYSSDADGERAAFAATGRNIHLAPYLVALSNWKANAGITTGEWRACGAAGACGAVSSQSAKQVCPTSTPELDPSGVGAVVRAWPTRLRDEINHIGAFEVLMGGNAVSAPAGAFLGSIFTAAANANAHCQQYGWLEMTTDGTTFTTSVVATMSRPLVSFRMARRLTGATFGLVPWDQPCSAQSVRLRTVLADSDFLPDPTADRRGASTFDVSQLVQEGREGYYMLCYAAEGRGAWRPVELSYVKVIRDRLSGGVQVEAIGTGNPADSQEEILLWHTQAAAWYLAGEFDTTVAVNFLLTWDDQSCEVATAAYSTPVKVISSTGGQVTIDTSLIVPPPGSPATSVTAGTEGHFLYPCYRTAASSRAHPLSFEVRRGRRISLSPLSLSSINYLPHYGISYEATTDASLQLTDPRKPPITRVAIFSANDLSERDEVTAYCSIASPHLVTTLPVSVDSFGMRWLVVPASVARMVGRAGSEVYLVMCATASTAPNPHFESVSAYITVSQEGMDEGGDVYLDLSFAPLNLSTDVLDISGATAALVSYVTTVLPAVEAAQVMVADLGFNQFALYVQPATVAGRAGTTGSPTAELYTKLADGEKLPLVAASTVNASSFVLKSAVGFRLGTQMTHSSFPFITLRTRGEVEVAVGATESIALFCIVITPTMVGFVVFSLQRTIPSMGKKKIGEEAEANTVYPETGDSPPPRNPRAEYPVEVADDSGVTKADAAGAGDGLNASATKARGPTARPASQVELVVEPNAEDTAANPLYNDDSDVDNAALCVSSDGAKASVKDMGCSPPLRNATFAMSLNKPAAESMGSSPRKRDSRPPSCSSEDDLR